MKREKHLHLNRDEFLLIHTVIFIMKVAFYGGKNTKELVAGSFYLESIGNTFLTLHRVCTSLCIGSMFTLPPVDSQLELNPIIQEKLVIGKAYPNICKIYIKLSSTRSKSSSHNFFSPYLRLLIKKPRKKFLCPSA